MYATPEDIRARYKEVYLILAGKDAEGRPDTAAVEQALAEAASEIDAILGTRFAVPVSPVPPVLRRIAVDLAVGALPRTGATEASMYERRAREARELWTSWPRARPVWGRAMTRPRRAAAARGASAMSCVRPTSAAVWRTTDGWSHPGVSFSG